MAFLEIKHMDESLFSKAIDICMKQERRFKDKEVKKKRYTAMREKFEKGKETFRQLIEITKTIKVKDGTEEVSFFDKFIKGKESTLTIAKIYALKEAHSADITADTKENADKIVDDDTMVDLHEDFIDDVKQVGHDILHGKGLGKGIMTASLGVCAVELLTHGITSQLTKQGIMQGSMGLLGLGKMGLEALPGAWQGITSAFTAFAGWSPVAAITGGVFVAAAVIPLVTNMVKKIQDKNKEARAFGENMNKLVEEQASRT